MAIAGLIIIRATTASTPVLWEIERALSVHRSKTALLLIDGQGNPFGKQRYLAFKERIEHSCSVKLPEAGWNSWYVWFDDAGRPRLVDATSPHEPRTGLEDATCQLAAEKQWSRSILDPFLSREYLLLKYGPVAALGGSVAWFLLSE